MFAVVGINELLKTVKVGEAIYSRKK